MLESMRDIPTFIMYCVYGVPGPSLLIKSTNYRAVGSDAAGKAMASPLFAVTCRMYTQPLLVPRTCTNVYRILA